MAKIKIEITIDESEYKNWHDADEGAHKQAHQTAKEIEQMLKQSSYLTKFNITSTVEQ